MAKKAQHALCLPFPTQGHITPMLHLAKLLHSRGFNVTFVNTEFNHHRLINSGALDPTIQIDGFWLETIPDGLMQTPEIMDATQNIPNLTLSVTNNCLGPLRQLVSKISGPPLTCMVRDAIMICAQDLAHHLGIPDAALWTMSASSLMAFFHFQDLITKGYAPFKDSSQFSNGYLDTPIDWIPSMPDIRLRDIPTFIRATDPNDTMLNFCIKILQTLPKSSAVILNTLQELEHEIIDTSATTFNFARPPYALGPLFQLQAQIPETHLKKHSPINSNLWAEDYECLNWLDRHDPATVVYVNFGSIAVLTPLQLEEFAWGLANSKSPFLWVIRPDLVSGESAILAPSFMEETRGRGLLTGWCPQKEVLGHSSIGVFLTHCGWNSTMESIYSGVPMLCWPFFADQVTNCRFVCHVWGLGMEIDSNVRRDEVEVLVREMVEEETGEKMRKNVRELKETARKAVEVGGSSHGSFEKLVNDLLVMNC